MSDDFQEDSDGDDSARSDNPLYPEVRPRVRPSLCYHVCWQRGPSRALAWLTAQRGAPCVPRVQPDLQLVLAPEPQPEPEPGLAPAPRGSANGGDAAQLKQLRDALRHALDVDGRMHRRQSSKRLSDLSHTASEPTLSRISVPVRLCLPGREDVSLSRWFRAVDV